MLLTSTALPLLVALAAIGLESETILPENAAALVGAGVLSVIVFPAIAISLQRPTAHPLADERLPRTAEPPPTSGETADTQHEP